MQVILVGCRSIIDRNLTVACPAWLPILTASITPNHHGASDLNVLAIFMSKSSLFSVFSTLIGDILYYSIILIRQEIAILRCPLWVLSNHLYESTPWHELTSDRRKHTYIMPIAYRFFLPSIVQRFPATLSHIYCRKWTTPNATATGETLSVSTSYGGFSCAAAHASTFSNSVYRTNTFHGHVMYWWRTLNWSGGAAEPLTKYAKKPSAPKVSHVALNIVLS